MTKSALSVLIIVFKYAGRKVLTNSNVFDTNKLMMHKSSHHFFSSGTCRITKVNAD